jgi:hypothetical protein
MSSIRSAFSPSAEGNFSTQQTLTLIGLAGLTTLLLAIVPWLGLIHFPFRLLITMVHELGHGLAAVITGGKFIRFVISPNGAGLAYTAGGWRLVVIPAGYLAAALFGAVLIMLGRNHRWSRIAMAIIGVALILLSLRYGTPSIFASPLSGVLTTITGVILGGLFLWLALKAAPGWIIFWLHVVAIQAGLMAFSDLIAVVGISTRFFNMPNNDAKSMAELTLIPAIVWAVLWAITALFIIGVAIWVTWLAPRQK